MKRFFSIALLLLTTTVGFAQFGLKKHASWTFDVPTQTVKVGDVVEIKFNATIDPTWHLYSNILKVEGPRPTEFTFKKNDTYQLVGQPKPIGFHDFYEEVWGGNTSVAEGKASFVQKVKILKENVAIDGSISFQTCQNDGMCVASDEDFKLTITAVPGPAVENITPTKGQEEAHNAIKAANPSADTAKTIAVQAPSNNNAETASVVSTPAANQPIKPTEDAPQSLWAFLVWCFVGGFWSIFMPCIYPIMPMTVNFFTKQENGRSKAVFYGLCIIFIYTFFGFIISLLFGADAANVISTHWIPNLIFFLVFIVFGLSFLGLFEITLPSKFVNDVDKQADKGGLMGIFFMALTLVVVSFSCTAPIASQLLIQAADGSQFLRPILGMVAYSLPFAIVFAGLAMFPELLKSLPKSGGWLNEFKVVFGILEFALALKFLSNIDLAYHWNTLDREIFLAIWIVLFSLIGFYVMGKIRMDKDTPVKGLSIPRFLIVSAVLSFVVYMIPGMFGAPLRGLSGWLPPEQTQDFYLTNNGTGTATTSSATRKPHLPLGLHGFFNFEEAQAEAKKQNKPIFIDFTGYACANCRKMEANVWPEPAVLAHLQNNVIIASLYVDDKTELPQNEQFKSVYDGKLKTTVGAKNMDLEITKFNNNAQPYYCLVTPDGEVLLPPVGYSSAEDFVKFLDTGLANFKK
jgi:thiol:disulfide interchange protein